MQIDSQIDNQQILWIEYFQKIGGDHTFPYFSQTSDAGQGGVQE